MSLRKTIFSPGIRINDFNEVQYRQKFAHNEVIEFHFFVKFGRSEVNDIQLNDFPNFRSRSSDCKKRSSEVYEIQKILTSQVRGSRISKNIAKFQLRFGEFPMLT